MAENLCTLTTLSVRDTAGVGPVLATREMLALAQDACLLVEAVLTQIEDRRLCDAAVFLLRDVMSVMAGAHAALAGEVVAYEEEAMSLAGGRGNRAPGFLSLLEARHSDPGLSNRALAAQQSIACRLRATLAEIGGGAQPETRA